MHLEVHEVLQGAVHEHHDPYVQGQAHRDFNRALDLHVLQSYSHTCMQSYRFYPTVLQFPYMYTVIQVLSYSPTVSIHVYSHTGSIQHSYSLSDSTSH
jgi:hypothetical protein